jgi:hypothetical protein
VTLSKDDLIKVLLGELKESERRGRHLPHRRTGQRRGGGERARRGDPRSLGRGALVDREPMANWTHSSRYVLLSDLRDALSLRTSFRKPCIWTRFARSVRKRALANGLIRPHLPWSGNARVIHGMQEATGSSPLSSTS